MKRCPKCDRVETDDALGFCRIDGAALINDSSSINSEAGTAKLGSASLASEVATSFLPHTTDTNPSRSTGPTTVLQPAPPSAVNTPVKPKRRTTGLVIAI